jgi:hypothetical protein
MKKNQSKPAVIGTEQVDKAEIDKIFPPIILSLRNSNSILN